MAELWPETLPQCFIEGSVAWQLGDGRLRTAMDAGPAKSRLRTSAVSDVLIGTMKFTAAQWVDFKEFVSITILRSDPFLFPNPDDAASGSELLVRFGDSLPAGARTRGYYVAQLELEVLP